MIDRVAPARRPVGWPVVNYQEWRSLLFLHWPVPVEALRPLVPKRLTLDLYEGEAYVGVIPFLVQRLWPVGVPRALGFGFLETNCRTYVHLQGRQPGVYFFSLDAASPLAVAGARAAFGLPYFFAGMRMERHDGLVEYRLRRRSLLGRAPGLNVRYEIGEPLGSSEPGTLQHLLIERYLLHVERPLAGGLWTTQVHHRPYPVRAARVLELQDELVGAAGLPEPGGPPIVHYSPGVDVEVFAPRWRGADGPGAGTPSHGW
jgi:uncharacterized protein YqjF (DUF2071 family)